MQYGNKIKKIYQAYFGLLSVYIWTVINWTYLFQTPCMTLYFEKYQNVFEPIFEPDMLSLFQFNRRQRYNKIFKEVTKHANYFLRKQRNSNLSLLYTVINIWNNGYSVGSLWMPWLLVTNLKVGFFQKNLCYNGMSSMITKFF